MFCWRYSLSMKSDAFFSQGNSRGANFFKNFQKTSHLIRQPGEFQDPEPFPISCPCHFCLPVSHRTGGLLFQVNSKKKVFVTVCVIQRKMPWLPVTKNFQICTWLLVVVQYLVEATVSRKVTERSLYMWENINSKNCSFWSQDSLFQLCPTKKVR